MPYRIKTEVEFILEFGRRWRDDVRYSFPEDMDHLLGTTIKDSKARLLYREEIDEIIIDACSISRDMIAPINLVKMKNHIERLREGQV